MRTKKDVEETLKYYRVRPIYKNKDIILFKTEKGGLLGIYNRLTKEYHEVEKFIYKTVLARVRAESKEKYIRLAIQEYITYL